jgi:hypothetical protein
MGNQVENIRERMLSLRRLKAVNSKGMDRLFASRFRSVGDSTEPPIIMIIKGHNQKVLVYSILSSAILFNKYQRLQHVIPKFKYHEPEVGQGVESRALYFPITQISNLTDL